MDYQKIKIDTFNDEQNYWFVRTNGGSYYNEYKTKGFIAFGVNSICDTKLLEAAEKDKKAKEQLVTQIKADYENKTKNFNYVYAMIEYQPTDKPRKNIIKTGLIISQLNRFMREMKIGDIVLIPSVDSDEITFGKITSDYYIDKVSPLEGFFEYNHKCPFFKRRNVKWIKTIKKDDLEPFLYKVIYSHHSITDVSYARNYINRSLSDVYISNDKLYITFNINKKTGIPAKDLLGYIKDCIKLCSDNELEDIMTRNNIDINENIKTKQNFNKIIKVIIKDLFDEEKNENKNKKLREYFSNIYNGKSATFDIGYSGRPEVYLSILCRKPIDTFFLNINQDETLKYAKAANYRLKTFFDGKR